MNSQVPFLQLGLNRLNPIIGEDFKTQRAHVSNDQDADKLEAYVFQILEDALVQPVGTPTAVTVSFLFHHHTTKHI